MKVVTIGRNPENDVVFNDPSVSRHHCQITQYDNGSFTLSDFGSTNGTYVNGHRISGEVPLSPTDVVRVGNTTMPWKTYLTGETYIPYAATGISAPPAPPTRGFGFGLAGCICGVTGVSVLAIIFSSISLARGERLRGLAISGLITGIIYLGIEFWLFLEFVLLVTLE